MSVTAITSLALAGVRPVDQGQKLKKSAQEFEAMLLESWMEKMNQSFVGGPESQDAAHDTISSLGTHAIATSMAARGGIGIARMLLRHLGPQAPAPAASRMGEGRANEKENPALKSRAASADP